MKTVSFRGKNYNVFSIIHCGGSYEVICVEEKYQRDDSLAVLLLCVEDGAVTEEFGVATVNLGTYGMPEGYAYLDTNNLPQVEDFVKGNGLASDTGRMAGSGYCSYPLYKWDTSKFYAE